MSNPSNPVAFYQFLVDHAKFSFPEASTDCSFGSTDISLVEVGMLHDEWKARRAVCDNNLAEKLCSALWTTLSEASLSSESERDLLQFFSPTLSVDRVDGTVIPIWEENPNEAHSTRLLDLGVLNAAQRCLSRYDRLKFLAQAQQKVPVANSIADFHVLVNNVFVAVVEVKSPSVMNALRDMLPPHGFELRWTQGSNNLVSRIFSKAALYLGLRQQEWLFLTCHNYWIVIRLVRGDNPFIAFSPIISMDDSSVPFRAFLGAILSVFKGEVVEASTFDDSQTLDKIDEEEGPPPGPSSSNHNLGPENGSGEYKVHPHKRPVGHHPITHSMAKRGGPTLTISSSSPLSPESFQVWIHLHSFPNNIFGLPSNVHKGEQRLWLTHLLGQGSTGSVWKCHFDDFEKPFAVKVVEMLRPSDIEARKRFCNEFETYVAMEEAYRSGKLLDRIAPRCYGAFQGDHIDVLILDLHDTILDSWDRLKPQERLQIFKLVWALHSLGIAHGDLEPRNLVRTDGGKFLLIDFTASAMHQSKKCVAQNMTQSEGEPIPLKNYKCNELNMLRRLIPSEPSPW